MDDLSNLGYISVIKNGKRYYNNRIRTIKNPYIIGAAYVDFKEPKEQHQFNLTDDGPNIIEGIEKITDWIRKS